MALRMNHGCIAGGSGAAGSNESFFSQDYFSTALRCAKRRPDARWSATEHQNIRAELRVGIFLRSKFGGHCVHIDCGCRCENRSSRRPHPHVDCKWRKENGILLRNFEMICRKQRRARFLFAKGNRVTAAIMLINLKIFAIDHGKGKNPEFVTLRIQSFETFVLFRQKLDRRSPLITASVLSIP
jgi:hypothetical protein